MMSLKEFALKLYDLGFNVVPVDKSKRPLTETWSPNKRVDRAELEKLDNADGVAIVAGPENPWKPVSYLIIVDVDKPSVLEKTPTLKELITKTVSWYTGVRCPKCENKHVEVIEQGKRFKCPKCGLEFAVENAKRGLGALFTVDYDAFEKHLKSTIRFGDVEILAKNYQLIPPSLHPSGVRYEWLKSFDFDAPNYGVYALTPVELEAILKEIKARQETKPRQVDAILKEIEELRQEAKPKKLRELSDSDLLKLKELLKEAYKPGNRQMIVLYMSGWMAKAGISPVSTAKLVKMLHDETNDEDSLKMRLGAVVYSYKKAGIDVDAYANEIKQITDVEPYGLGKEFSEEEVKGKSGLQEILEGVVGEDRALAIIKEIEDVLGASSPFRDSIIELLDYEKQLYAVANLRALIIARARLVEENGRARLIYKEKIAVVAPVKIVVYDSPLGGIRKYEMVFEGKTLQKPLAIGPASIEEIADRLKAEGLVYHSKLIEDVLSAIANGAIRKGKAETRTEIEKPGFYYVNEKITAVKYEIANVSANELRDALTPLNELAEKWYNHVVEKFSMVVKWGIIAPFSYIYKQKGRWIPWLYLYGSSHTGKTTLGEIVLSIWGLGASNIKSGSSIDTVARLGGVLSQSTFPVLVNEPGNAINKEDVVEMMKSAIESPIARGRYVKGSYTEIPSLAPLMLTSNKVLPKDDALLRRLIVLHFSFGEQIPQDKASEFQKEVKPRLTKLKAIGQFIAKKVVENPSLLNVDADDWRETAKNLLTIAYKEMGLEPPKWLELEAESKTLEELSEEVKEIVRERMLQRINNEYNKFVGKVVVEAGNTINSIERTQADFKTRVQTVLSNNLIPWAMLKENSVYINTGVLDELKDLPITSLKALAELFGWEYKDKSFKMGKKVIRRSVAIVDLDDFIEFLALETKEE